MNLNQLKRIIIITRPIFWLLYPILFIIGLNAAGGKLDLTNWAMLAELIALTFPAALLTYGVNDAFDMRTDARNPRKKNRLMNRIIMRYWKLLAAG